MEWVLEDGKFYNQLCPYDNYRYEDWNINLSFLPWCVKYILIHLTDFPLILTPSPLLMPNTLLNNVLILFIVHDIIMELPHTQKRNEKDADFEQDAWSSSWKEGMFAAIWILAKF